jgi:protein-tyrosine phosphatase
METSSCVLNIPVLPDNPNFRDFGGIVTSNGLKIRPGMVFRSGDLGHLTDEEVGLLERLGLNSIIDFRSPREVDHRPDKAISTVVESLNLCIHDRSREKATWFLRHSDAAGLESLLIDDYRVMVRENRPEFAAFLHYLSTTDNFPVVFHCAAGKDRTGLAAIFLLTALGVEWENISRDYFATNVHNASYSQSMIEKINSLGYQGELMRPMLEVRKEYLDAALEVIDSDFGGLWNYVAVELKAEVEKLRGRFLFEAIGSRQ